jgi:hypothetical protein
MPNDLQSSLRMHSLSATELIMTRFLKSTGGDVEVSYEIPPKLKLYLFLEISHSSLNISLGLTKSV